MKINRKTHGTVDVIQLPQRLSMADAGNVREDLHELVMQGRNNLVLDLARVSFMDSSGLSVLLSARKSVAPHNGQVVLLNPSAEARVLIELTRLHEVFDIFIDHDAAVEFLSQG
jgi:anti-sigma B factor antagonist